MLTPAVIWGLCRDALTRGRATARENGLTLRKILADQLRLRLMTGMSRDEYYIYRLWRPELTLEDKLSYITFQMVEAVWRHLGPTPYWSLVQNKLISRQIFTGEGLPIPKLLAVYDSDWGYTNDGRPFRKPGHIAQWFEETRPDAFVLKPIEGERGQGVLVFERTNAQGASLKYEAPEGIVADSGALAELIARPGAFGAYTYPDGTKFREGYVLEERLRTHPALMDLTPHSCGSVRVITMLGWRGKAETICAFYKVQGRKQSADNFGGAINVSVDAETGRLGMGFVRKLRRPPDFRSDPLSGVEFAGRQLPFWHETVELAERVAHVLPFARSIGCDIALTERGPILLEANYCWNPLVSQAVAGRGFLRGEMLEYCCDASDRRLRRIAHRLLGKRSETGIRQESVRE